MDALDAIYRHRFPDDREGAKDRVWLEIVHHLQRYIAPDSVVLDVGCDRGHFIRHVQAAERWATDLRDCSKHLPREVHFVQADGLDLANRLPQGYFTVVFMSNYLEHLPSAEAVLEQLSVARQLLRDGGQLIVLQPNIRLVGGAYWDFLDHHVPLTEKSLSEAADLSGFSTRTIITRFLPYTTKGPFPLHPMLVRLYLQLPPAWLFLGKQTLYIGERR